MKLSNKNRTDIKKKQDKNFKKFLEEANPMVTRKVETNDSDTYLPTVNLIAFISAVFVIAIFLI